MRPRRWARRLLVTGAVATTAAVALAGPATACGFLVGPNGSVRLDRTATLVAYQDGVEHYVTSFEFASDQESFGSIIPLPDVPTSVERAGDWTLQRLQQEVAPPLFAAEALAVDAAAGSTGGAEVLLETRIDSLDLTVLRGGGDAVAEWAEGNGFLLSDKAPEMLRFYAERSPIFLAARFDAAAAEADGFASGDGIPVHVEIPTDDPWVPLRILTLDKPADEVVEADVFLLTEEEPRYLAGPGVVAARSEPAPERLLADLRSDTSSSWIPESAWFTYLDVSVPAGDLQYDLAMSVDGTAPSLADTGVGLLPSLLEMREALTGLVGAADEASGSEAWAGILIGAGAVIAVGGAWWLTRPELRVLRSR